MSLAFAVPKRLAPAYRFRPGQYLTLRATIGGDDIRRSYSICSGLDDCELRVAVKRVAGGAFSNFVNDRLKPGDAVEVMTPAGRFTLPPAEGARTIVAIACGSGITPILSHLKTVLAREPDSRFVLLYGNRTSRDIMFAEALAALKDRHLGRFSLTHVLSREMQDLPVLLGRLDRARIELLLLRSAGAGRPTRRTLLCGPAGMMDEAPRGLAARGSRSSAIHREYFTPGEGGRAAATPPSAAVGSAAGGNRRDYHRRPASRAVPLPEACRSSTRRAPRGSTCRSRARAACAAPAARGWSSARLRWRSTTRCSRGRSRPGLSSPVAPRPTLPGVWCWIGDAV